MSATQSNLNPGISVMNYVHVKMLALQDFANQVRQALVIFDQQNSHNGSISHLSGREEKTKLVIFGFITLSLP